MKIGYCANMNANGPDKTGIERVMQLAEIGFDYIELPLAEITGLKQPEFEEVLQRVNSSGVKCESCNNFFPPSMRLTGDDTNTETIMEYVEKALDRAAKLGAKRVVFGSGPAKNIPDGFPRDTGYTQIVSLLQNIAPVADKHGITIAIEPLRKQECNIINTFAEGCKLAGDVGCSSIKVLVDYYHLTVENEPPENIVKYKEYLCHVHFARPEGRGFPSDISEDTGYTAFFNALKQAGYTQRISLEAFTGNFELEAPAALTFLRQHSQA